MDEPQKHYAKWKKSGAEDHMLYDSIYVKCLEKANPRPRKTDGHQGLGLEMEIGCKQIQGFSGGDDYTIL